jgi:hypothetical protein
MAMTEKHVEMTTLVTDTKDQEYLDFQARRLVESAAHCVLGYLLLQAANKDESFRRSAEVYVNYGQAEVNKMHSYVMNFDRESLGYFKEQA